MLMSSCLPHLTSPHRAQVVVAGWAQRKQASILSSWVLGVCCAG